MLISALMPGFMTVAALGGFNGIVAFLIAERPIFISPMLIAAGGGAEHSASLQVTFSPISVAARRDISKSGLPLSTQPRTRLVDPSGSGRYTSMTTRLWSSVIGTVTDFGSVAGLGEF